MSAKKNERREATAAETSELSDTAGDVAGVVIAGIRDRNLRDVADCVTRHDEGVMTDDARSELSRLCSRVPAGRRSLTEWAYLLARDAAGEPIDSPSDGRFGAFRAFAEAEQQFEFALVRTPRSFVVSRNGGAPANFSATIPAFRGRPAQRIEMPLGEPVKLTARQAIFILQQFPLCAVETTRPGGDMAGI